MSTSLFDLVAGLKARHSGPNSWMALCPGHEDRTPSLSISDKDGKILVRCHAGCSQESVIGTLKKMGLWSSGRGMKKPATRENYTPKTKTGKTFSSLDQIVTFLKKGKGEADPKIYHYPGEWGVIRIDFMEKEEKKKLIRPFHSIPGGFALGDPTGPLSLYSTQNLTVGFDDIVYVVEGEKCVDAMEQIGLLAVTSAHGAKSAKKSEWRQLKGRKIVILPDNDRAGKTYAEEVRTILEDLKCSVRILNPYPSESPEGFDVADWLEIENSDGVKEKILTLVESRKDKEDQNWEEDLMRNEKGNLKQNTHNILLIIENDPDFSDIRFDEFTKNNFVRGEKLETSALVRLAATIEKKYSLPGALTERALAPVCEAVGKKRPFHPVRDWLNGLKWDGINRVDHLFETHYGALPPGDYTRAVARNFMIGAVSRIYRPGCKLDNMIVLEGKQGIKKSSSLKALFGDEFVSEVKASPDSKDFDQALQGMWCLEFAELDSLQKSDITRIKMQLSTQADWIRLPYKPAYQSFPRQSVFVGTTNDDGYLKDPTGARRFWPVKCTQVDIEGIRNDREQLFAEAVHRFKNGETWWDLPPGAEEEQDLRFQHDVWEEYILPYISGLSEVKMADIFGEECLDAKKSQSDRAMQTRVGNILKRHGWEKKRIRTHSGRAYTYVPTTKIGTDRDNIGTSNTVATVPTVPTKNEDMYRGNNDDHSDDREEQGQGGIRERKSVGTVGPVGTCKQNQGLTGVPTMDPTVDEMDEDVPILDLNLFLREG